MWTNSEDQDQTVKTKIRLQSDQGLHCLIFGDMKTMVEALSLSFRVYIVKLVGVQNLGTLPCMLIFNTTFEPPCEKTCLQVF